MLNNPVHRSGRVRDLQPAQQLDADRHVYRHVQQLLLPPNASQPGGANDIETGDPRISRMAMYNAGSNFASINAASGSNSEAIPYQIQPFVIANAGGANDGQIAGTRILNEFV